MIEETITLKLKDYTITINKKDNTATYQKSDIPSPLNAFELKTGILLCDLNSFNGYMFYDNNKNFYNTITKTIYFKDKHIFIGDKDKEAFSLFDNYEQIEKNIKKGIRDKKEEFNDN